MGGPTTPSIFIITYFQTTSIIATSTMAMKSRKTPNNEGEYVINNSETSNQDWILNAYRSLEPRVRLIVYDSSNAAATHYPNPISFETLTKHYNFRTICENSHPRTYVPTDDLSNPPVPHPSKPVSSIAMPPVAPWSHSAGASTAGGLEYWLAALYSSDVRPRRRRIMVISNCTCRRVR